MASRYAINNWISYKKRFEEFANSKVSAVHVYSWKRVCFVRLSILNNFHFLFQPALRNRVGRYVAVEQERRWHHSVSASQTWSLSLQPAPAPHHMVFGSGDSTTQRGCDVTTGFANVCQSICPRFFFFFFWELEFYSLTLLHRQYTSAIICFRVGVFIFICKKLAKSVIHCQT